MKKMIFAAFAAVTIAFASCSKEAQTETNIPSNGPQVQISLTNEAKSRAFFDSDAAAEAWEKEITLLTVYAFDHDGNILVKRSLTGAEISSKSARFSLPNSAAGKTATFFAVANAEYGDVQTVTAMENLIEAATLDDYNGTFAQTAQGRKRPSGFVMTGRESTTIAASGSSTDVGMTIKRVVAKIAVQAKMSSDFSSIFNGGSVTITSAVMSQANSKSYSIAESGDCYSGPFNYSHAQASNITGDLYQNMFYAYETKPGLSQTERVLLTLKGYFDADGNPTTTYDRSDVEYKIYLDGAGEGEIKRNGYYRVEATIKGLSGDGVIVTFTVADWETPVTQTVDLGV